MDIYIDPLQSPPSLRMDSSSDRVLYTTVKFNHPPLLRIKRGDKLPLKVEVLRSKPSGIMRLGVKLKGDYNSPLLLFASAPAEIQSNGSVIFEFMLNINSQELAAAFGLDNRATGRSSVAAEAEFIWNDGELTRISDSLQVTITNDIIKGLDAELPTLPQSATIDLNYSARSSNAQSGLAVDEALELSPKATCPS